MSATEYVLHVSLIAVVSIVGIGIVETAMMVTLNEVTDTFIDQVGTNPNSAQCTPNPPTIYSPDFGGRNGPPDPLPPN